MSSVAELVVRRFIRLYGPPATHDEDAFFDEYHKALNGTDPSILEEAMDAVVKRVVIPAWPTPGACVEAVNEVAERRMNERRRQQTSAEPDEYRKPTPEQRERVNAIVRTAAENIRRLGRKTSEATKGASIKIDWDRGSEPAWQERMETSETARQLSLPRDFRGGR